MPTKISKIDFSFISDMVTPKTIMTIKVIRGRFHVVRYVFMLLKLNIIIVTKKSSRIASLPNAGNCGYAHHKTPYPTIVTKR